MGFVVTAKVRDMEDNKKYGRSRRVRNDVVGCVQDVAGKNIS